MKMGIKMWLFYFFNFIVLINVNSQGCQKSYSNMAIMGNDLANVAGQSSACCQLCQQQSGCTAYTWNDYNGGTCWLKNDSQPLYASNGDFTVMMVPDASRAYTLNISYDGVNFFDNFNFALGTKGCGCFVNYTDRSTAEKEGLIGIKNGKVYIGVDNITVLPWNTSIGRNSIHIESIHTLNAGLVILSIDHVPTGPGLWPAFWTYGPDWPNSGEIDILESEAINDIMNNKNQISLHTFDNCNMGVNDTMYFSGTLVSSTSCSSNHTNDAGCSISAPNGTYNTQFNKAGGGVFAMEWNREKFIRSWTFVKPAIPDDILNNNPNPNPSTWGMPTAYFSIGPNCFKSAIFCTPCTSNHFHDHIITINSALCGAVDKWFAGGQCGCENTVRFAPYEYSEAYWLINYVKVFCKPGESCIA